MSRLMTIHRLVFASLTLSCVAGAWWGCSAAPSGQTGGSDTTTTTSSTGGTGGAGGTTNIGGLDTDGGSTLDDGGACTSTNVKAERVPLDLIFLVDRSMSMSGAKWAGTTTALTDFFNDPASSKIGAGLSYFPNFTADACIPEGYEILQVPINALPGNAFALTNSMPADAKGTSTPTYEAMKGTLLAATAYQDAHDTHKVAVVVATDGDPFGCPTTSIDLIADLAKSARNYNGVLTFVIGVAGSTIGNLDKIAAAGGTTKSYDVTSDISQFSAKMEEIRGAALGCEFEIPPPPDGMDLDKDKVNFSYTPQGMGDPKVLLRAKDLFDCAGDPGWYYNNNNSPTKIILCPASCATVQLDSKAEVEVLFGCKTQIK